MTQVEAQALGLTGVVAGLAATSAVAWEVSAGGQKVQGAVEAGWQGGLRTYGSEVHHTGEVEEKQSLHQRKNWITCRQKNYIMKNQLRQVLAGQQSTKLWSLIHPGSELGADQSVWEGAPAIREATASLCGAPRKTQKYTTPPKKQPHQKSQSWQYSKLTHLFNLGVPIDWSLCVNFLAHRNRTSFQTEPDNTEHHILQFV